jgi:hypothetical protein
MDGFVTRAAEHYQVLRYVQSTARATNNMMDLKLQSRAAALASPPVTL